MLLVLPDSLIGRDEEFVRQSITERLPAILISVISKHTLTSAQQQRIQHIADELAAETFVVENIDASDGGSDWSSYGETGKNALDVGWFFFENYLYRLLLRETEYFSNRLDPFRTHKLEALSVGINGLALPEKNTFRAFIEAALWGNRADLSISAGKVQSAFGKNQHLLVDHDCVLPACGVITYILDNCGAELLNDLLLVHFLLMSDLVVHLHSKSAPVFVSDAIVNDVYEHIDTISSKFPIIGLKLREALSSGKLIITDDEFYQSPLPFWNSPQHLKDLYTSSTLTIIKGDANYRRLLGDRKWPHVFAFGDIMRYWPGDAVLSLRTCKAPIVVGIHETILNKKQPSNWLVDGTHGCISLYVAHFNRSHR